MLSEPIVPTTVICCKVFEVKNASALMGLCLAMIASQVHAADSNSRIEGDRQVYVARRGSHIDIGMAIADLVPPLNQVASDLPGARYVFFGFADKHYMLAAKHNAPVLLSALWPGAGIVLTTGLPNSPAEAFGRQVIMLNLAPDQIRALQAFIWRSLRTQSDVLHVYRQGPYEGSVYYLAAPKYSAIHTCNTWGAEALRAAGFRVHTTGVIFAWQLWTQAKRLKRLQAVNIRRLSSEVLQGLVNTVPAWAYIPQRLGGFGRCPDNTQHGYYRNRTRIDGAPLERDRF
jgi:Protein of unknown function (DUF2459)